MDFDEQSLLRLARRPTLPFRSPTSEGVQARRLAACSTASAQRQPQRPRCAKLNGDACSQAPAAVLHLHHRENLDSLSLRFLQAALTMPCDCYRRAALPLHCSSAIESSACATSVRQGTCSQIPTVQTLYYRSE